MLIELVSLDSPSFNGKKFQVGKNKTDLINAQGDDLEEFVCFFIVTVTLFDYT